MEFLVDFDAKKREEEKRRLDDAEEVKNEENEAVHFNPNEGILINKPSFTLSSCCIEFHYKIWLLN